MLGKLFFLAQLASHLLWIFFGVFLHTFWHFNSFFFDGLYQFTLVYLTHFATQYHCQTLFSLFLHHIGRTGHRLCIWRTSFVYLQLSALSQWWKTHSWLEIESFIKGWLPPFFRYDCERECVKTDTIMSIEMVKDKEKLVFLPVYCM